MEGVFAVNKPPSISSAGVLRKLEEVFTPSKHFAPWLHLERKRLEDVWASSSQHRSGRQRRKMQQLRVKLGHGGTLDPMATGVLIVGVGKGTKTLNSFLECTKSYETVVVFGTATDSYDAVGKIVGRAPTEGVTRAKVEEALQKFRGKFLQTPPIFSALKVQGMPLYEYARKGLEVPRKIEERRVEVTQLEMLEWLEPGSHEYPAPQEELEEGVVKVAQELLGVPAGSSADGQASHNGDAATGEKRKREDSTDELVTPSSPNAKRLREDDEVPTMAGALPAADAETAAGEADVATSPAPAPPEQGASEEALSNGDASATPSLAPAVRLRMTVSSGFYVRSLAHDLGQAVGSLGYMAALVRTRQGDFELGKDTFEVGDLDEGEEVWAPKLEKLLVKSEDAIGTEEREVKERKSPG